MIATLICVLSAWIAPCGVGVRCFIPKYQFPGYNTRGNLGTGDTTQRNAPSKVKGTWNVNIREVALKTGNSYDGSYDIFGTSCALTFSGTVWSDFFCLSHLTR